MHDTLVVFKRSIALSIQNPIWIIISLIQPILYLVLFGPILLSIAQTPGFPPGDAWQVFVPGLLVQLGVFGAFFVGFGIIAEWRAGVIERMLVAPIHRTALLSGLVIRDIIIVIMQGLVMMGLSYLFGLRISLGAILFSLLIISFLAATFSYLSYAAALATKSEDVLAPIINSLALPILLLSGILLPMSLAPRWLQIVSDFNPVKHVVVALRASFRGEMLTFDIVLGVSIVMAITMASAFVGNLAIKSLSR